MAQIKILSIIWNILLHYSVPIKMVNIIQTLFGFQGFPVKSSMMEDSLMNLRSPPE